MTIGVQGFCISSDVVFDARWTFIDLVHHACTRSPQIVWTPFARYNADPKRRLSRPPSLRVGWPKARAFWIHSLQGVLYYSIKTAFAVLPIPFARRATWYLSTRLRDICLRSVAGPPLRQVYTVIQSLHGSGQETSRLLPGVLGRQSNRRKDQLLCLYVVGLFFVLEPRSRVARSMPRETESEVPKSPRAGRCPCHQ